MSRETHLGVFRGGAPLPYSTRPFNIDVVEWIVVGTTSKGPPKHVAALRKTSPFRQAAYLRTQTGGVWGHSVQCSEGTAFLGHSVSGAQCFGGTVFRGHSVSGAHVTV